MNTKENNFVANVVIFTGVVSALITILQLFLYYFWGIEKIGIFEVVRLYYGEQYRPVGTFDGPVGSAIILFTIYILSIYKFSSTNNKLYLFAAAILVTGILCTLTRTAIIALFLSMFFQSIHISILKKSLKPIITVITVITIIVLLVLNLAYEVVEARFVDITQSSSIDNFGAGRIGIWISILYGFFKEMDLLNFIIGFGIDMSRYFVLTYSNFSFGYEDATHNDYLDCFITNGFISLSLMIIFLINILKKITTSQSIKIKSNFFFPLLFYFLIVLMLSNTNYSAGQRWFFLILVAFILNELEFNKPSEPNKVNVNNPIDYVTKPR